jgi:hypothetical protein
MNEILNRELKILVALITSEIRSREDKKEKWAKFKNQHEDKLRTILNLPEDANAKAGELIGFDIDHDNRLILLNYTSQAHNLLHEIPGGWTDQIRAMRGLVYSYERPGQLEGIELVSRGFEKFFNQSELPETRRENLSKIAGDRKLVCREKADGHMIEYFMLDDNYLHGTTRGKFGTVSAVESLRMLNRAQWIKADNIVKSVGKNLMTLVVELVTVNTEVHVDYDGLETLYLLAAYDKSGEKIHDAILSDIVGAMPDTFALPETKMMSLDEIYDEVSDRSVHNKEGWVVQFDNRLVKFKYETYIGRMVASKLSYKYLMRCIQKGRLDKMVNTLQEEVRDVAHIMTDEIMLKVKECVDSGSYLPLYDLHSSLDGGVNYYKTVCREFYREWIIDQQ